jgi:hypothetical protein
VFAVDGIISVKEWTRVHSSLEVSLHKDKNMLGEQITAGQLTNRECITMHLDDMKITMRFIWALQHDT